MAAFYRSLQFVNLERTYVAPSGRLIKSLRRTARHEKLIIFRLIRFYRNICPYVR